MSGFTTLTGKAVVLLTDQIDTDRIIPARFLSRIERSGYGELLFNDIRKAEPCFELNLPEAQGGEILIVGTNFGCGSSREHAVWALQQAGFKAIVARKDPDSPGYSDIFRQNSANCGLLLVELTAEDHQRLAQVGTGATVTIDLPNQTVLWEGGTAKFEINVATKDQMLKGLDLIGLTMEHEQDISKFERSWSSFAPTGQ